MLVLLMLFVVLMIKTAWVGDDAYISFRPLDNLLNGHGLRWNVAERVQVGKADRNRVDELEWRRGHLPLAFVVDHVPLLPS